MVCKGFQINGIHDTLKSADGRLMLLIISGVLTGFTLIFTQIGLLEWLTLVPTVYVLIYLIKKQDVKIKHIYGYGLFFFMSFYLVIYHWFIYLYPLEFTGMGHGAAVVVVLSGWFGLSLIQALVGGLIFVFAVLIGRTGLIKKHGFLIPFIIASLWVMFEWSQTLFWTGVPWARLAIGQTDMPVMFQSVSLFGSYFITFLIVAVNSCLAYAIYEKNKVRLCAVCAAGMVLLNTVVGGVLLLTYSEKDDTKITAAVIQANIASGDKWDMKTSDMLDIFVDYTGSAAESDPDIIIWSETAIPVVLENSPNTVKRISNLSIECDTPILVGMFTEDDEGNEYNSLVLFNPDGSISDETYSKQHLVPFGEYMPWRALISTLIPPLGEIAMLDDDLTPGKDSGIIESNGVKYGSLICFDSIYENLTRSSVLDGAEIMIISTNDSWFYDSAAGRMHNAQAKLRAVESGRYILRAANTGISSVITPTGKTVDELAPLTGGYIVTEVSARDGNTFYMLTGNIFVIAAAFFCLTPFAVSVIKVMKRRKSRESNNTSK